MAKVLYVICSSIILAALYQHVTSQQLRRRPKFRPPFAGFGLHPAGSASTEIRLKGLCRDGWTEATSQDIYGNEIPICIKINENTQTWNEARESCRKDFGFLLKVDSPIKIDDDDLMSVVLSKGITNLWTGAHTENSHLVWDDLAPEQLRPNNGNQTNSRPWNWSTESPSKISQYCGKLKINQKDDDRRKKRKKRQIFETSESDSSDSILGNTDSLFGLNPNFDSSRSGNDGYPQASAFQEMLTRTQLNDQLAEQPTAALGVPSAQQLPGSGLLADNLQKGGLGTVPPLFGQRPDQSNSDSEIKDVSSSDTSSLLGFQMSNDGHNLNLKKPDGFDKNSMSPGQLYNQQPNPTDATSLIDSVHEQAAKLGLSSHLPSPTPTEMLETLNDRLIEHGLIQNVDTSEAKPQDMMGLLSGHLTDGSQSRGNDNLDLKSHDILNIVNSNGMNINPLEQGKEHSIFGSPEILNPFDKLNSNFGQIDASPTTVSPLINAFMGNDVQNSDDSSSLSDSIKDLLKGVTNSEPSQKDLSDAAKDMLQTLQPDAPSHSETMESLADKLSNVKGASITTPATNIFDPNNKANENFEAVSDSISHKMEDKSTDSNAAFLLNSDKVFNDKGAVSLSAENVDLHSSDDSSNSESSSRLDKTDKISAILQNDGMKLKEDTLNDDTETLTENTAEKILDKLSIDTTSETGESPKLFESKDNTDLPNKKLTQLDMDTDEDTSNKPEKVNLPSSFENENEKIDGFSILSPNQNPNDITKVQENDEKKSPAIDISDDDDQSKHDVVIVDEKKVHDAPLQDDQREETASDHDLDRQKEITDSLNAYLSATDPNTDTNTDIIEQERDFSADQSPGPELQLTGEIVKSTADEEDNPETQQIDLKTPESDVSPESNVFENKDDHEELKLENNKPDNVVNSRITDLNEEIRDEQSGRVSEDESLLGKPGHTGDDTDTYEAVQEEEGVKEDMKQSEISEIVNTHENQTIEMDEDSEDPVETLLKEFKRNTTQDENDETILELNDKQTEIETDQTEDPNADTTRNIEADEDKDHEKIENVSEVNADVISEFDDKDEALKNDKEQNTDGRQETKEEKIESLVPDKTDILGSDDEIDKNDLLENYGKLLGNNRRDTEVNAADQMEESDIDDLGETTESDDKQTIKETVEDQKVENDEIEDHNGMTVEPLGKNTESSLDEMPTLAEVMTHENEKSAILPVVGEQELELSSCRQKLSSVCFTYQLEVMSKVSTCEKGWYGHILHNKCYRILNVKQNYRKAAAECSVLGGGLVDGESEFERSFTLLAVSLDGVLFRGTKFWMQSRVDGICQYFDERGVKDESNCNRPLNAICEKPVMKMEISMVGDPEISQEKLFMTTADDALLRCPLKGSTYELPVMWFKDGLLISTITSDDSGDSSLQLDRKLIESIRFRTNRYMTMAGLQGKYWCEVWDKGTADGPSKRRSGAYDVRFSDVMSFHGSMELKHFTYQEELLFNLMDKTFPSLSATEKDLKKVFRDVVPVMRRSTDYVKGIYTHVDRVRSSPRVLEYHTYITLTRNYSLEDETQVYNRLKGLLRATLGNTDYMSQLPGKTPVTTFRTMALQSTISCPAASLRTNKDSTLKIISPRVFKFQNSLLGERVDSQETCDDVDLRPAGSAECLGDFYTGAYWGDVRANDCTPLPVPVDEEPIDKFNEDIWGKTPQTDTLIEMAETVVNEANIENITGKVAKITSEAVAFTPTDINKIADVLDHSAQMANMPEEAGINVIKTVDKLMTLSEKEVKVANIETKAANRIIKSLEKCAENVDMTKKDNFRMVTDNIAVEVWMLKEDSRPVIGLAAHTDKKTPQNIFTPKDIATVFNKSQLFDANVDAAIELPKEAFAPKVKGQPARNKLTMMVFRKSKLFEMAAHSADGKALSMDKNDISQLNSYVISASIAGKQLKDLKEKVRTIFKPLQESRDNHNCVFWDFNLNDQKGGWSDKGCIYDGRVNGREVCLCNHLTNFAVLLDFYGQENPIHKDHELSLSIITIIGLSFSILGLALTIVSFVFFKKLRQGRAQQTLFNLAVALLCAMMVFLIGIKQTHHYWWCLVSAVLLHYFVLASFMWMLMEAILQYLTFVKILGTYITRFTLKTVIPAWGLPLVPVIVILSVDYTLYKGGSEYCWMSLPAFYYGFAIPISCIIVTNIIIFVITIISIMRRGKGLRSNQKKKKVAMTNLQAAITSFILLGLSWLFGYLAIADARLPFQYIFTILNSLQGFFIFILFVVRKKKVREQWYIVCCKGTEKEKVSRSLSASNSIPSSYSNGSNSRSNSKHAGKDRDRSDSTKTVTSTFSGGSFSNGFTNYGYDKSFDIPYNRRTYRNF